MPRRSSRGSGRSTTPTTCAGRGERMISRSASRTASRTLWVTISTVTGLDCQSSMRSSPQPVGGRLVERDERLVEQQDLRLDRKGARQRRAPRHAERQLGGIAVAEAGQLDGVEDRSQVLRRKGRRQSEPDVLLHRPPWQQARLLEHGGHPRLPQLVGDGAAEIAVEAKHDPQRRRLAAARRADQAGEGLAAQARRRGRG